VAKVNVKVTLLCPIEEVWGVVTNLEKYSWRSDLRRIDILDENHFVEVTKEGIETEFVTTKMVKFKIWEFRMENKNIKGSWCGKFFENGERTTLDFTEEVFAKSIFKKPFLIGYLRKQQRQYFVDLKKTLNCDEASFIQLL